MLKLESVKSAIKATQLKMESVFCLTQQDHKIKVANHGTMASVINAQPDGISLMELVIQLMTFAEHGMKEQVSVNLAIKVTLFQMENVLEMKLN